MNKAVVPIKYILIKRKTQKGWRSKWNAFALFPDGLLLHFSTFSITTIVYENTTVYMWITREKLIYQKKFDIFWFWLSLVLTYLNLSWDSPCSLKREIHPSESREPPLSSTLSPSSEDSGLDDSLYRSPLEEPESAVEREIRLTLERDERHRRERGIIAQGLAIPR